MEQAGLAALIALLLLAGVSSVLAGDGLDSGRGLAAAIARRIACAPRLPDACRHHPLVPAYGWPLARLVRALAPAPSAEPGPSGLPLVPVDFRRCRRESCAVPLPGPAGAHLTSSGRRTTAFTELADERRRDGTVRVTYWLYRPGLDWQEVVRDRRQWRRSRRRPGCGFCSATTPTWCRSRPCPAATITTSRRVKRRRGNGACRASTRAGRVEHCERSSPEPGAPASLCQAAYPFTRISPFARSTVPGAQTWIALTQEYSGWEVVSVTFSRN